MTVVAIAPSPPAAGLVVGAVAELDLLATPRTVGVARRWVVQQLEFLGVAEESACVAELLSSELVTNAVRHGVSEGTVTVRVSPEARSVVVAVLDESEQLPRPVRAAQDDLSGRGLPIVAELAADWGYDHHPAGGKIVWFRVPR